MRKGKAPRSTQQARTIKSVRRASEQAAVSQLEKLEDRRLMAATPVIVYNFDAVAGTAVPNVGGDAKYAGTIVGDEGLLPTVETTDPSPQGGGYLHLTSSEPNGTTFENQGGRVDVGNAADATSGLQPILNAGPATLSFYIRTTQVGAGSNNAWESPGVTGVEQAGAGDDGFWGNLTNSGQVRVEFGDGTRAVTPDPVNDGTWRLITQTRDPATGLLRTYLDGLLVSLATGATGAKGSLFRAIGATTDVAADGTTIQGYNYLNGDLDQVEIYNVALTPREIVQKYGQPVAAAPATVAPLTAVANTSNRVDLSFTDVENEAGYAILRSASAAGPFTEITELSPDQTTFADTNVVQGTQYFYQVVAFNQAGDSPIAAANVTTPVPGAEPLIDYKFDDAADGTTAANSGTAGATYAGTLAGDLLPTFETANPSPAGGSYLHFEGDGAYQGSGGRVDSATLLNPILGGTSTLSFYIRTNQVGVDNTWQSPAVTGAEQAGGGDDIFWGNLGPNGEARLQAGNGAISASTPLTDAGWVRVTHTRNATTGVVRTFVNGALVSETVSETGQKGANFRSIGANTDVAGDLVTVEGYNHLNGDLDDVQIFDRELTLQEVAQRFGPAAGAVPAAPTGVTATPTARDVTLTFTDTANEAGYVVLRSTTTGGPFTQIGTIGANQTTFVDPNVSFETQYFYQIVAYNAAGNSAPGTASTTTLFPARDPIVRYDFEDAATGDAVDNTGTGQDTYDGVLTGDALPTFQTTGPSPAGGAYLRFEVSADGADPSAPTFENQGGRVDSNELLNPILGGTSTLSYYIRTNQIGNANTWQSPGVTGAEQAGGGDDIFWGNLDPSGAARVVAGNGAASASTSLTNAGWVRVTQTRNATTGVVRTYVNGTLVSEATSEAGQKGANFRSIGANTDVAADLSSVQGYNYLNGDLDDVEIFDRELTAPEVSRFYGPPDTGAKITNIYTRGTNWSTTFRNFLATQSGQDSSAGFKVTGSNASSPVLSFSNLDTLAVKFNGNVPPSLAAGSVTITSAGGRTYTVASVTPDPTDPTIALVKLSTPIVNDRVTIALAGVSTADGSPAQVTLNVLPADVNQSGGAVNAADLVLTRNRIGRSTANPGTGATAYSVFNDVNGDGLINASDLVLVRNNVGKSLPAAPALVFSGSRIAPASRDRELLDELQ